jgi:heat shock protein HslJ
MHAELLALVSRYDREEKKRRVKMKKLQWIMITILVFVIAACGGGNPNSIVGTWELVSYGPASSQTPVSIYTNTMVDFDSAGELSGNVGCNSFSGDYKVKGDEITFGRITTTLMACEDPINTQEASVLGTFTETTTYTLSGDMLTITSADGESVVILKRK